MQPSQILYSTLTLLGMLTLSSCGDNQKGDKGNHTNVQMSGAVVDDYIAYARVYVDINNNNKLDSRFEPYAFTDGFGYFSKSKEGQNYCADPRKPEYKYCLNVNNELIKNYVIRIENGRDLLTGQEYSSTMTMLTDGSTDELRITAVSSINQAENELKTLKSFINTLDLKGTTNGKDFQAFLENFLSDQNTNPNKIDPFKNKNNYKLAINIHKMVETIATYFANHDIKFKSNNYMGRKENDPLKTQDFVPFIYMSLYLNMNFSKNETTLSEIDNTVANNILTDTESLLTLVTNLSTNNNQETYNHDEIINTLASLYDFLDGLTINTDDPRKTLVKAEIVTQAIKQEINKSNTNDIIDVNKFTTIVNNSNTDSYQTLDFESAVNQVVNATNSDTKISATGKDFAPVLNAIVDDHKYFDLTPDNSSSTQNESDITAFAIYFQQTSSKEITEKKEGNLIVCIQTQKGNDSPKNELYKGSWSWSKNKEYALFAEYLGVNIALKNLNPSSNNSEDKCGLSAKSCLSVTYPNISPDNPDDSNLDQLLTNYYHDDQTDWNTQTSQSELLKTIPSGYPQTPEQCFLN